MNARRTTNRVGWLLQYFDVDRPVAYALAMRIWQFPAGLVTAVLITLCFSPEVQGFYYTVATLLAFQTFVDLGLNWVILHVASHEWAQLELDPQRRVGGDPAARARLAGLVVFFTRWFLVAATIFALSVGGVGTWLFAREPHRVAWLLPWCAVLLLATGSLALSPRVAVLEGCQQVLAVNRVRFWQAVTGSVVVWAAMLSGAGLWVVAVATLVQLVWELYLVRGLYRPFFTSLSHVSARFHWRRDVWPLQWRIGIQSVVRYFAFYLFTPVMFAFHGAVVAGQMGMTWSILSNIQLAAFAWLRTRAPRYGALIARREYDVLDREFLRVFSVSFLALLLALGAFTSLIFTFGLTRVHLLESLAQRFLDPGTIAVFAFGLVASHIAQCLVVYLRAHKRDPLVCVLVTANVLIGASVFWFGSHDGPRAAAWAFTGVTALVTLPGVAIIWFICRRQWHADGVTQTE